MLTLHELRVCLGRQQTAREILVVHIPALVVAAELLHRLPFVIIEFISHPGHDILELVHCDRSAIRGIAAESIVQDKRTLHTLLLRLFFHHLAK